MKGKLRMRSVWIALLILILPTALLNSSAPAYADSFGSVPERWADSFCGDGEVCRIGDVNGDGKDDVLAFIRSSQTDEHQGEVRVALSDGSAFDLTNAPWQTFFCLNDEVCAVGDVNGDGNDDIIAFVRDSQPGAPPYPQTGRCRWLVFAGTDGLPEPSFSLRRTEFVVGHGPGEALNSIPSPCTM